MAVVVNVLEARIMMLDGNSYTLENKGQEGFYYKQEDAYYPNLKAFAKDKFGDIKLKDIVCM